MFAHIVVIAALARDVPFKPPIIPTPVDPGQQASPYESRLATPDLKGSEGSFDLEGLSYVKTRFTIGADLSGLNNVTSDNSDAFLQHVAADPRWRLVAWDGAIVAFKRTTQGEIWTVPFRGYHEAKNTAWRAALRFSPWKPGAPWHNSPLVSQASSMDKKIKISVFTLEQRPDLQAVAMSWQGPVVTYELYEAAREVELTQTVNELSKLPGFMTLATLPGIEKTGYSKPGMPKNGVKEGEPTVGIAAAANGQLDLHAWIHVPGRGVTWARILDTELAPWEEAAVATGTREIVGWGPKEDSLFFMQGRFPVPAGKHMSATVEIWHQPDGGEPARIGAFPVTIPDR